MKAKLTAKLIEEGASPFAFVGLAVMDKAIESTVTPAMMRQVFASAKRKSEKPINYGMSAKDMHTERNGLSEFRLTSEDGGAFIFKRDGLSWKLSEMRLPDDIFDGA